MKVVRAWVTCALLVAYAMPALAADPAEERLARAYYDEAVKELEKSSPAKSRLMFERVIAIAPNSVGARLMVGECRKREGKLASAWRAYRDAIDVATKMEQPLRAEQAARLAASLEARVAKLHVQLPPDAWTTPGLQIRIDEKVIDTAMARAGFPVDTGEHVIDLSAEGKRRVERRVTVENDGVRIDVEMEMPPAIEPPPMAAPAPVMPPTLVAVPLAPASKSIIGDKPTALASQTLPSPSLSKSRMQRQTAGIAVGTTGAVALLAGGLAGIMALERRNASNDGFCEGNRCSPTGIALREQSLRAGDVSTGLLIAGTVLAGAGATLVLWPVKKAERVEMAFGPTGFAIQGMF